MPGENEQGVPTLGESVTFEEMEQQLAAGTPGNTDLTKTLEGAGVPDDLKGKPVSDVIAEITRRRQESAAAAAGAEAAQRVIAAQPAPAAAPIQATQPEAEKELTEEELTKLYEENPVAAIKRMNEQAERRVMRNLEGRMAPMAGGFAQMAEQEARKRFVDEFALFGDDIQKIINSLPNPALMSNPKAWDDLIGLVRGRPGNFEKLLKHVQTKTIGTAAQTEQALSAGFHPAPRASEGPQPRAQLTPVQKEVAREMGLSDDEYVFWGNNTK